MHRYLGVLLLIALVASIGLGGCTTSQAPTKSDAPTTTSPTTKPATTSGETVTWTFNWNKAPGLSSDAAAFRPGGRFQTTLLNKSGGRFKLTIREAMVSDRESEDLIATNKVQIGDAGITGVGPIAMDFGALPFRFTSLYQLEKCMQDPEMVQIIKAIWEPLGLKHLAQLPSGVMKYVYAKKPIEKISDFQGLKIRVAGKSATDAFKALGAGPVAMPSAELPDALSRGLVDGCVTTLDFGLSNRLTDMITHISVWPIMPMRSAALFANLKAFDALPADLKTALLQTAVEVSAQQYYSAEPEEEAFRNWLSSSKTKYVIPQKAEVEKAKQLMTSVYTDWIKDAGTYGQKILDISAKYLTDE